MRILVAQDWDELNVHALCGLGHDFLLMGCPGERRVRWRASVRPMPGNARGLLYREEGRLPQADCLVVFVKPGCSYTQTSPEAHLLDTYDAIEGLCASFAGDRIVFLLRAPGLALVEAVPPWESAIFDRFKKVFGAHPVACDAAATGAFWRVPEARVIYSGLDPLDYPPSRPDVRDIVAVLDREQSPTSDSLVRSVIALCGGDMEIRHRDRSGRVAGFTHARHAHLLASHGVFCSPEVSHFLPHALCEAMMAGLAIIAYDTPAVRELIRDGSNGILVQDAQGFAAALAKLKGCPVLRAALGQEARATAMSNFHINKFLNAWDQLLS